MLRDKQGMGGLFELKFNFQAIIGSSTIQSIVQIVFFFLERYIILWYIYKTIIAF